MKYLLIAFLTAALLAGCAGAKTGGVKDGPADTPASEKSAGPGLSLMEAVEQSAVKIAGELPKGSRMAIVAFESASEGLSDYLMEELTGALFDRGFEMVDRQNLEYVYKEFEFQMSGSVNDDDVKSIGKFLAADVIITGQLIDLDGAYRYRVNAIHLEQAARVGIIRLDVRSDSATRRMVAALTGRITGVKAAKYGAGSQTAPQTAGGFFDRGTMSANKDEHVAAITDFTEALKLDPNMSTAYALRGLSHYRLGNCAAAIADYDLAIQSAPNLAVVYNHRGIAHACLNNLTKAVDDFTQAMRLNPNLISAPYNRGNAYYEKGDNDRGIADFNRAIQLNPEYALAYNARCAAHGDKGDFAEAIADCNRALSLDPDLSVAYESRGAAYLGMDNLGKAIADFDQAIRIDPKSFTAYGNRGIAHYKNGAYDKAVEDFEAVLRINPNDTFTKRNLERAKGKIR